MRRTRRKLLLPVIEVVHEYNVMPFGLANAPGIFQELMSIVLHGLGKFAMAYLDDIIIFSASEEEHKQHIDCLKNLKLLIMQKEA